MSNKKGYDTINSIKYIFIVLVLLAVIWLCGCTERPPLSNNENTGGPVAESPSTDAAESPEPSALPEPSCTRREELEITARSLLHGEAIPFRHHPYSYNGAGSDAVTFFYKGGSEAAFAAYNDPSMQGEPITSFPPELAEQAARSLTVYANAIGFQTVYQTEGISDGLFGEGYCGRNWFILKTEGWNTKSVHTIWLDGGDGWHEFGSNNGEAADITGAVILSPDTAFLCEYSYAYNGGLDFKVFGSFDGGETWRDMELKLPDEYSGYFISNAYAPYFEGEHGIILASAFYEDGTYIFGGFITEDGGRSWGAFTPAQ